MSWSITVGHTFSKWHGAIRFINVSRHHRVFRTLPFRTNVCSKRITSVVASLRRDSFLRVRIYFKFRRRHSTWVNSFKGSSGSTTVLYNDVGNELSFLYLWRNTIVSSAMVYRGMFLTWYICVCCLAILGPVKCEHTIQGFFLYREQGT